MLAIKALVMSDADVHAKDSHGDTASHICSKLGLKECLQYLLTQNPSLFSKNKQGDSPLDVAKD